jgi:chromosome segregation ATPase
MATPLSSSVQQLKQAETEIAVLQVQFKNLDEKVDELKVDLKDMRDDLHKNSDSTQSMLKEFQGENIKAHKEMAVKISALEKWRWMLMGAGVVIGALGWPAVSKLLGM